MSYTPQTIASILEATAHTFIGRAARAPEMRYLESGKSVAKVRVAVNNGKDQDPHWFTIEAWDHLAERLADDCDKGTSIKVIGRVVENRWQTKAGEDRLDLIIKAQDVEVLRDRQQQRSKPASDDLPF
jgi:single-strand DNA-binding protein